MLKEAFLICRETSGGFCLSDIKNLYFDDYEIVLKEAARIQDETLKAMK